MQAFFVMTEAFNETEYLVLKEMHNRDQKVMRTETTDKVMEL